MMAEAALRAQARRLATELRKLGPEITPDMLSGTTALFAPMHTTDAADRVQITRDLHYGSAERHRLDIFAPSPRAGELQPVLLFVHGGGFIGGDKRTRGSPFFDNVGRWAAKQSLVGVTMTYRLAPEHPWPAGSDDVRAAVAWIRENIASYGGDAARVVVMGQSAGAVHVAGFLARDHREADAWRPAGAILVSGLYDTLTMERNALFRLYFGEEPAASAAFLTALASTPVPFMTVTAEIDPLDFLRQTAVLHDACIRQSGKLPRFVQASGDNHLSTVLQLDSSVDRLGSTLFEFIADTTG